MIEILKPKEYSIWEKFIENHPDGTFFHSHHHLKTLAELLGFSFEIICVFKDKEIIAGVPVIYSKKIGIPYIYQISLTPVYCPLLNERDSKYNSKKESYAFSVLNELMSAVEKKYKIIKFIFPTTMKDVRPYTWNGYQPYVHYTYQLELEKLASYEEKFDPSMKRQLKKAEKSDYSIEKSSEDNFISALFDLQMKSFKRQKIDFFLNKQQFLKWANKAREHVNIKVYIIKKNLVNVSSVMILIDRNKAYYFLAGTDPNYFGTGLPQKLLHYVLHDLKEQEIPIFDFLGANTETISKYKSLFGFQLIPYFSVKKTKGSLPEMLWYVKKKML